MDTKLDNSDAEQQQLQENGFPGLPDDGQEMTDDGGEIKSSPGEKKIADDQDESKGAAIGCANVQPDTKTILADTNESKTLSECVVYEGNESPILLSKLKINESALHSIQTSLTDSEDDTKTVDSSNKECKSKTTDERDCESGFKSGKEEETKKHSKETSPEIVQLGSDEIKSIEHGSTEFKRESSNHSKVNNECELTKNHEIAQKTDEELENEERDSLCATGLGCTLRPTEKKRKTRLTYNFLRYLQLSMLVILSVDVILISMQVSEKGNQEALQYCGIVIAIVFMIDLVLRLYAYGLRMLKSILEVLDMIIVISSFVITILFYVYQVERDMQYFKLLIIGRPVRYFRLLRLCKYRKTFQEVSQKIVSQNRHRLQDEEYNLDVTYITKQILVMSYPSEGCTTLIRNSCKEVARFLNNRITGSHYTIYNLCSEQTYDTTCFDGPVVWCPIDDHNVPSLSNMVQYAKLIRSFIEKHEDNTAVIHCKGGKGRTGTIVSALLIQGGRSAEESLKKFAQERTDTGVHLCCCVQREQGVRVPSQIRYVHYFEKLMTEYKEKLPQRKELMLHSIVFTNISGISHKNGQDLIIWVQQMHPGKLWEYELLPQVPSNCVVECDNEQKRIAVIIPGQPVICDDIKVTCFKIRKFSRRTPTCLFYFWFHTAFCDGLKLELCKKDLDTRSRHFLNRALTEFKVQMNFLEIPKQIAKPKKIPLVQFIDLDTSSDSFV